MLLQLSAVSGIVLLLWSAFFLSTVHAATAPTLLLTVQNLDGEPVVGVVNGQTVVLGWYVDGPVENCTITQDNSLIGQQVIVAIDTSVLPTSGSQQVIPPADSSTSYILSCDRYVEEVPVNTNPPSVTLSSDQGIDLMNNSLTGRVDNLVIRWNSLNATRCSYISRSASSTGLITETSHVDYSNRLGTSGWIRYDGDPRLINETTEFSITCYNDNTGAEATDSLLVNVSNPPPPSPPVVNLWSPDTPTGIVARSELYGYAWVDVSYNSANVTYCNQQAYYEDGTQYPNGQPAPWDTRSNLSYNYTNIRLASTTVFEITCGRPAVTIGTETYPATSTTRQLRIEVIMPDGVSEELQNWDRSYLPPVTASIAVEPDPVMINAVTGYAYPNATVVRENADFCDLKAYRYDPVNGTYSAITTVSNWGGRIWGNGTSTYDIRVSTTTRLVADCWRTYDLNFSDAGGQDNGHYVASYLLTVNPPLVAADPPHVDIYGNAVRRNADEMWNTAIERVGFNNRTGSPRYIENTDAATTSSRIRFPFPHPYGDANTYDIHLKLCDENDGESTFRIYTEKDGLVGQYTTDKSSPHPYCGDAYGTVRFVPVAQAIDLEDGDIITVECDTPNDGERCRLHEVLFGAPGLVITPQVNPFVTSVTQRLLWLSQRTTSCWNFKATRANGSTYTWYGGSVTRGLLDQTISTSTSYSVTCGRPSPGDGLTDSDTVNVFVPFSTTLSTEVTFDSGSCIDDGSITGTFGPIDAPPGYGPDDDGICIPLVDLAATSPAVSIADAVADPVQGTYDDVRVLLAVRNVLFNEVGAALPADSQISYKANMQLMPAHALPDVESGTGYFNGGLAEPTLPLGYTESATLIRTFDDVPFGTHTICGRINLDGSPNYAEANPDLGNNEQCTTIDLPVPRPPMTLNADRTLIRMDQSATISWGVNVAYELACTVRGPGGLSASFNTLSTGPGHTDSYPTAPLTSTGEYQLECTEPLTGTSFTELLRVNMVPEVQEI